MVKAYYIDEVVADPRAPNEQTPNVPARFETLNLLNCFYKFYDPAEHFQHYVAEENVGINNADDKDDDVEAHDRPLKDNKTRFEKEFVYPLMAELHYKHYDLITVSEAALGEKFDSISRSQLQEHIHEDDEVRVIVSGEGYFDIRDPVSGNLEHHSSPPRANEKKEDRPTRYAYLSQLYRQITDSNHPQHMERQKEEVLVKWEHLLDAPHFTNNNNNDNHHNNNHKSKQPPRLPAGPHQQKHQHQQHLQAPFQFRNKWIRIAVTAGDCLIVPKGIYHRFTTTSAKHITALRLFKENPKWLSLSSPAGDSPHNKDRRAYLGQILFQNVFCYETAVGEVAAPYYYHNDPQWHPDLHENDTISIFNKNVFSFQTFYPEEVNRALHHVLYHFISHLQKQTSAHPSHKIIFYFTASKTPMTGQPWCPDCVRSHPLVKEAYHQLQNQNNNNNNNNNILYCEFPVERPAYKNNPSYYYRTHPFFQLNNVPTVFVLTVKPSVLQAWDTTVNNNNNNNNNNNHHHNYHFQNENELQWTEWLEVKLKTVDPSVEELLSAS